MMRAHRARRAFLPLIALLAMVLAVCGGQVPATAAPDGPSDGAAVAAPGDASDEAAVTLTVDTARPVITLGASDRFSLTLRVTNHTDAPLDAGRVTVSTNPNVAFTSARDMQSWAEGTLNIWSAGLVGSAAMPAIGPGVTRTVTVTQEADAYPFSECRSFGARPILATYRTDDRATRLSLHTFVTVQMADAGADAGEEGGEEGEESGRVRVAVAAPVTAGSWENSGAQVTGLLTGESDYDADSVLTPTLAVGSQAAVDALGAHAGLEAVADPYCLDALSGAPQGSVSLLQPAGADITMLTRILTADRASAGVSDTALYASSAQSLAARHGYPSALALAWQGAGNWTETALSHAVDEGYAAVVSTGMRDADADPDAGGGAGDASGGVSMGGAYHAVSRFESRSGSLAVLSAEETLSRLASGHATSDAADAEASTEGRVNRLVAQSSLAASRAAQEGVTTDFYASQADAQADYGTLLIALDPSSECADLDEVLSALEGAGWVEQASLKSLIATASQSAPSFEPAATSGVSDAAIDVVSQMMASFASSRAMIDRFLRSVLSPDQSSEAALRRERWQASLYALHDAYALRGSTIAGEARTGRTMISNATTMAAQLLGCVTITQPGSVLMMSDAANLPVTVVNRTPFPVSVTLSARPGTTSIAADGSVPLTVPGNGEGQAVVGLHAYSSGSSYVALQLSDATGETLGTGVHVTVSSTLRMNGRLGYIIIAVAVLLAIGGLWRQFHRKKDPDL